MASIVRIKRRQSQEPAEALLLAAKRKRMDGCLETAEVGVCAAQENVFRFCGTTENEKENMDDIAKLVEKGKLMAHRQNPRASRGSRILRQHVMSSTTNSEKKYKVLNTLRNLVDTHTDVKIYDLVLEGEAQLKPDIPTCNGVPFVVEKCEVPKDKYVYDIYYSDKGTIDDSYIDCLMSVQPYYYHAEDHEDETDEQNESDDSNDENNWRNEYPPTDDDEESDDELVGKMCGMYVDGNDELSSDDEDFIYSKDDDDPRHGDAYSKYKKRVAKDLLGSNSESEDDYDVDEPVESVD